jgi:hypothetical protein
MGQASRESRGSPTQSSRQLTPLVEDGERSLEPSPGSRRRVCLILGVGQTTARLLVNHRQFPERVTGLDTPASTELILFAFDFSSTVDEVD